MMKTEKIKIPREKINQKTAGKNYQQKKVEYIYEN